jgi:hypothetical protein
MKVRIMGPNLPEGTYTFHIHAGDCADIRRNPAYRGMRDEPSIEIGSLKDAVVYCYPPGDFDYAEGDWREHGADEFRIFGCVGDLPDERPATPDETTTATADSAVTARDRPSLRSQRKGHA